MRQLEKEFAGIGEVKGFTFKQLKASEFAYLYEVLATNGSKWYEVFEKEENVRFDCVSYPKQKSFGLWAFTADTLERAEAKFLELEQRVQTRIEKNRVKLLKQESNGNTVV
jgi:hypothetical protein